MGNSRSSDGEVTRQWSEVAATAATTQRQVPIRNSSLASGPEVKQAGNVRLAAALRTDSVALCEG